MKKFFLSSYLKVKSFRLIFCILLLVSYSAAKGRLINEKTFRNKLNIHKKENILHLAEITWEKNKNQNQKSSKIKWESIKKNEHELLIEAFDIKNFSAYKYETTLNSLNRSIVFDNNIIGPDISWIVPPGLAWNKKYKFDIHARGHNTQIPDPPKKNFFGWNDGDAVGLISYQFLRYPKSSFGINLGVRSLYEGDFASGGQSAIGDGISAGFRWDYSLSSNSGVAFGAEQLIHFDDKTDTGRNIYLTASKGWWSDEYEGVGIFPLYVATAGIGTGRMAVGTIKGLCSNIVSDGTDITADRRLCLAPVFSIASVWNEKLSTFFEYNSRFFLLGSSIIPSQKIPIRGTFALILSDHIDNYKFHDASEMNWVFNLSLGF